LCDVPVKKVGFPAKGFLSLPFLFPLALAFSLPTGRFLLLSSSSPVSGAR
jgi:hypothetical protein